MSGLLAARVLAEHFDQVTVVERDRLPVEGLPRRGVPQGRHVHVLLPRGAKILEDLFPGLLDELVQAGVPVADTLGEIYFDLNGHVFFHDHAAEGARRGEEAGSLYQPSRPFLEAAVLRRVRALPNVGFFDGCDVEVPTTNARLTRITGARIVSRDTSPVRRVLPADLVVVATGRSGRAPAWLKAMGYAPPSEEELPVDLKYVSQQVRFPEGSVDPRRALLIGPTAARPTGAGATAQEGDRWVVTFAGYGGHHPPMERESWLAFGDRFLPADFAAALHEAEPLEDLLQHRFSANLRRRYDRLERFPQGLLVSGDALCSFNPIYGQGMTVAALEALALRDCLRQGWDDLAPRFFKAAAKPIGDAWSFATGGDLAMPSDIVPGPRPLPLRAVNGYIDRFQAAAEHDPVMAWRFMDVTGFDMPMAALFAPDSLRRIASDSRHHRRTGSSRLATAAAEAQVWP
jgi:2-polyprenyl-6-methoxyphenol hydroxylase-like FAD-dependent oxidoreductase